MKIETVSGRKIDPEHPLSSDFDVKDIAWSLSRISRFAGHSLTTVPYNVAQHSVFVADMIYEATDNPVSALYGLFHDSAESIIGDIPSPVKKIASIKSQIEVIEYRLLDAIFESVGLVQMYYDSTHWGTVKYYDKLAQTIEAHAFMSSRGKDWNMGKYDIDFVEYQNFPQPMNAVESYKLFLKKYEEYKND